MNKGIRAHIISTLFYLPIVVIMLIGNGTPSNEIRLGLAIGYAMVQFVTFLFVYLDGLYKKNKILKSVSSH